MYVFTGAHNAHSHLDATWCALTSLNTIADNLKCNIYKRNLVQLTQVQETIATRVSVKVLSCDPKGDPHRVTFKISRNNPREIYLHPLYLTKLTETF